MGSGMTVDALRFSVFPLFSVGIRGTKYKSIPQACVVEICPTSPLYIPHLT